MLILYPKQEGWPIFTQETILITGGTGSFGAAFSRHLLTRNAKKVIILSRGWLAQKALRDELGDPPNFRWFVGDVRDKDRLTRALKGVSVLVHAAALKDLPTSEYNPREALLTNVIGTQNVIDAAIDCGVQKSLLISTDKAVSPCNTYGATKTLAERLWLNANSTAADDNIKFSVCRYGNVVGSAGSIVPSWKKLIEQGTKELPITDIRMTRFWMPMNDVLSFVENSVEKMRGGELYIPKLPSVRIVDLAEAFGLPYRVTGIRPGEKLHESLEEGYSSDQNEFLAVDQIRRTIQDF